VTAIVPFYAILFLPLEKQIGIHWNKIAYILMIATYKNPLIT
jgi:hypothetical protein